MIKFKLNGKEITANKGESIWQAAKNNNVEILEGMMGFHLDETYGIGSCSGIDGDPFSRITMPENLTNDQKDLLGQAEEKIGRMIPDASRYILAISSKPV